MSINRNHDVPSRMSFIFDLCVVLGLAFIGIGTWLIHPALMFTTLGVLFLSFGLYGVLKS